MRMSPRAEETRHAQPTPSILEVIASLTSDALQSAVARKLRGASRAQYPTGSSASRGSPHSARQPDPYFAAHPEAAR